MAQEKNSGCPFDHENLSPEDIAQLKQIPGSDGLPIVGETLSFVTSPSTFGGKMIEKYGSPFYANVLGSNMIFLKGTEANRWIFAGENKYLQNRWSAPIQELLGDDGVSMLTGDAHRARRKVLNPYFKYEKMDAFIPTIHQTIDEHLQRWSEQDTITAAMANRDLAFEIIARYIFGDIDDLPLTDLRDDFVEWTRGIFSMGIKLPFTRFGKAMQARERLWSQLTSIVESYQQREDLPPCVLQSLFEVVDEDGEHFSVSTIVDEIQVLLFAGHDTTVSAMTNILVFLAQHPEVVTQGREERATISDDMLTTSKGLKNLPYIDAVIFESMRLYPPVTGAFREMTEDRCFAGYHMPEGWSLNVPIVATHNDEDLWENVETFEPERFIREEHKKEALMYIPFGGGPRLCLGQNFAMIVMRLALASLFKNYQWELLPGQDLTIQIIPTPLPKDGGIMHFSKL